LPHFFLDKVLGLQPASLADTLPNLPAKFILLRMGKDADKAVREFLAKAGARGGKARAAKYPKSTLRKWAKKGGRPPKTGKGA
jgi:hypothetical protein